MIPRRFQTDLIFGLPSIYMSKVSSFKFCTVVVRAYLFYLYTILSNAQEPSNEAGMTSLTNHLN